MKTVITYGTFDLFHVGHVRLLKRLSKLGDKLIVGISTDDFNALKGKSSFYSYGERAEIVGSCKYVDYVFPESGWNQKKKDIQRFGAQVFAMGDDWKGKFDELNDICEVVYLPRTEDISTTSIKKKLERINNSDLERIEASIHDIVSVLKAIKK